MKNLLISMGVDSPLGLPKSRIALMGLLPNNKYYSNSFVPFKPLTELKQRKFSIDNKILKNQIRDQENIEPEKQKVQSLIKIRRLRVSVSRCSTTCRRRVNKVNSRASNTTQTESPEL